MTTNYTNNILKKLPYWFNAKHLNTPSNTKDFLNVFGELLERTSLTIDHAYKLCDLETFENKDYIVHKIIISGYGYILINGISPTNFTNEVEFVNSVGESYHGYFFDLYHGILYISNFKETDKIMIDSTDYTSKVSEHRIWDADLLDEYGLLYGIPRLSSENNLEYKNRLLEYSRTPANSTYHGISSYIGHCTGAFKVIEWVDSSTNIKLFDDVICSYIYVDNKPFFNVERINANTIIVKGNLDDKGVSKKIKYFYHFNIETLTDYFKNNKTYYSNFTPEESFLKIFNEISIKCPIMWGIARWGEHYWLEDISNENYYFISPTFDPDISKLTDK